MPGGIALTETFNNFSSNSDFRAEASQKTAKVKKTPETKNNNTKTTKLKKMCIYFWN